MNLRHILTLIRSELKAQFVSPVIYIFMIVFWILHGFFALRIGGFFAGGEASLDGAFFWHPWLYLILVPAVGMHLWSDERRDGTLELLFTYPVTVTEAVTAKYLAALTVLFLSLAGTFPLVATVFYLGSPDPGPMICGYLGSFCIAATFLSITCLTSSLTRSPVVSFILSLVVCLALNLAGWGPVLEVLRGFAVAPGVIDTVAGFSCMTHFETLQRGVIQLSDLLYFLSMIAFFLTLNGLVLDNRRNHRHILLSAVGLFLIAVAVNLLFTLVPIKWDCTVGKIYSMSESTERILKRVTSETPVSIAFYFSETHPDMPPAIKSFAARVWTLLEQFAALNPNIRLSKINPLPDSEAEDNARANFIFGSRQPSGESVYCGLSVKCVDRRVPIPALSPEMEPLLEYQLSTAVAEVVQPEVRKKITVITSIPLIERSAPETQNNSWIAFAELEKHYDVTYHLEASTYNLDLSPDTEKLVILVHPYAMSDRTQYDVDQYLLRGGKVLALLDAYPFSTAISSEFFNGPSPSRLSPLLESWGLAMSQQPVADLSLSPRDRASGQLYIQNLPLSAKQLNRDLLITQGLSELNLFAPAALTFKPTPGLTFTPIAQTSADGILYSLALLLDNRPIPLDELKIPHALYPVAGKVEGKFISAFPGGCPKLPKDFGVSDILTPSGPDSIHLSLSRRPGEVMVVGDIDFLANQAIMRNGETGFGTAVMPINDNFFFFQNMVDVLCGDPELVGIRVKPPSRRPLERIDAMLRTAAEKRQSVIETYEKQLSSVMQEIAGMQSQKQGNLISPEAEIKIKTLESERRRINQELKFQRRELRREIDALQLRLEILNIALLPLLLALVGIFVLFLRYRKCGAK